MDVALSFSTSDLDRLLTRLSSVDLSAHDRAVLDAVVGLGRVKAAAREAAEAAGFVVDAAEVSGEIGDPVDAFRRAFAPGGRANIGNLLPPR